MTARVLHLDGRHRIINRRPLTDATAMAPVIDAGRYALGRMQLVSRVRADIIERGLTLWAGTDAIRCALLALAEHAATVALTEIDRHDPQQTGMADLIDADTAEIPAVLAGLTPRMGAQHRAAVWTQLVDAATRRADLRIHEDRGTAPQYLRRYGRSAQDAMAAEDHDVTGIVTDCLAALCVHGHRAPDLPDGAA